MSVFLTGASLLLVGGILEYVIVLNQDEAHAVMPVRSWPV